MSAGGGRIERLIKSWRKRKNKFIEDAEVV
jgi:hypothetical protein